MTPDNVSPDNVNPDNVNPDNVNPDNVNPYDEPDDDHRVGLLEILVYGPLGAGLSALDLVPTVVETCVARGKAEVSRRHEQVVHGATNARSMGEFAWSFGLPKLRDRAQRRVGGARDAAGGIASRVLGEKSPPNARRAPASPPTSAPEEPAFAPAPSAARSRSGNGAAAADVLSGSVPPADAPANSDLAIPGYDALSASQVVQRLAGLTEGELAAVRTYEASHRKRRTILGKIEQLESPST